MINLIDYIYEKLDVNNIDPNKIKEKNLDNPKDWDKGDILCGIYGYNMSLPAWYEIIKKTPSGFTVVERTGKIVSGHYNGSWEEIPDNTKRNEDLAGKKISCRIKKYGGLKIGSVWVHLWDGKTPLSCNDMD
jgi:hypothetical protein